MAVNWLWKNEMGKLVIKNDNGYKNTIKIYAGSNCPAVLINHFVDEKGEKKYYFSGFVADAAHARNMAKDGCWFYYDKTISLEVNMWYGKSAQIFVDMCVRLGQKVKCYYKEPAWYKREMAKEAKAKEKARAKVKKASRTKGRIRISKQSLEKFREQQG